METTVPFLRNRLHQPGAAEGERPRQMPRHLRDSKQREPFPHVRELAGGGTAPPSALWLVTTVVETLPAVAGPTIVLARFRARQRLSGT